MKHKILLGILLIGLVIGACAPAILETLTEPVIEVQASEPVSEIAVKSTQLTITDDLGREITISEPPEAIIALGASTLESLFSIGAGGQIAGREEYSTFPDEALDIPSVGSLFGNLPVEAILALQPDLVIAPEIISLEQVQTLEDLDLLVYWQANPISFEEFYANIQALAQITGHVEEADVLISSISMRVAAVESALEYAETSPTVFYELDATDPENPFTVGAGVFIDTIIRLAGGRNIGAVLDGDFAQISSEEIILQDPDVIFLADAAYGVTPELVAERSGWTGISAIVNNRVYAFDPFLLSVPGPRMVDGLEIMAKSLHPELFD